MPTSQYAPGIPRRSLSKMRVLSLVALITLVSAASGSTTSETIGIAHVKHNSNRELAGGHKQVKRSLRQYDFNELTNPTSNHEERGIVDKVDDIATKVDDVIGKAKIPTNLNAAVEKATMTADDMAAMAKKIAAKYPEGLSAATMNQIQKVEQLRLKDVATYSKKTGKSMRRTIEPFEGIKIAPQRYLESHVGRGDQLYENGKRLLSSAVVSRSAKEGGGDVLLISSSNPTKNDWLLPKGGWEKGEDIKSTALREVIEEGGVRRSICLPLNFSINLCLCRLKRNCCTIWATSQMTGTNTIPTMMRSDTVYDDWAESVRYRLWVSYEDAIKLLAKRPQMVDMVKKAQETDELIKLGQLKAVDPKLANVAL
ncbi:RxLR effector family protein, partial [Phytophthora palmivora]